MKQDHKSPRHLKLEGQKNKIKMNELSAFVFELLNRHGELTAEDLMDQVLHKFGEIKVESLKRRKYDVLNILEMADIIAVDKDEKGEIRRYGMKHEMPNSVHDLERARTAVEEQKTQLRSKRKRLQMLKNTQANLAGLIEHNLSRDDSQVQKIKMPFILATQDFKEISQNKLGEMQLSFPSGTQFISNPFAQPQMFSGLA